MKCNECKYCIEDDYGYSNWTVCGTTADCLLNLNKGFPSDEWYGKDPAQGFANECIKFTKGNPVCFDVDGETTVEDYKDEGDIYKLLVAWYK